MRRSSGVAFAALLAVASGTLTAQAPGLAGDQVWSLDSLRAGTCIHFLVDPTVAAQSSVFRGASLLSAANVDSLNPALRGAVQGNPQIANWIPSSFCIYQFAAVTVGGRTITDRKGRSQAIALWSMPGSGASPVLVLVNNSRLSDAVKRFGVRIENMSAVFGKVPESTDDRYQIRYSGSSIVWDGRAVGDSMAPPDIQGQGTSPGRYGTTWKVTHEIHAGGSRYLAGSLRVDGKGELARMLTASPIRFVAPLVWGGSGRISFMP